MAFKQIEFPKISQKPKKSTGIAYFNDLLHSYHSKIVNYEFLTNNIRKNHFKNRRMSENLQKYNEEIIEIDSEIENIWEKAKVIGKIEALKNSKDFEFHKIKDYINDTPKNKKQIQIKDLINKEKIELPKISDSMYKIMTKTYREAKKSQETRKLNELINLFHVKT